MINYSIYEIFFCCPELERCARARDSLSQATALKTALKITSYCPKDCPKDPLLICAKPLLICAKLKRIPHITLP